MGFGGLHIWHLLIILLIVVLLFGTNKLRNIGADLGNAIKGFRSSLREGESPSGEAPSEKPKPADPARNEAGRVIDGQVTSRDAQKSG